jgi:hypothetical protein
MKTWLKANEYKIITSKDDPEDRKYFIAQHAADHLNGLLEARARSKNDKTCAASLPSRAKKIRPAPAPVQAGALAEAA